MLVLVAILAGVYFTYSEDAAPVDTGEVVTSTESTPDIDDIPLQATTTVVMKLNEKKTVSGTVFEPRAVIEDSRCPSDVQCIQAGRVRMSLNIYTAMGTSTNTLEVGKSVTTETLKITLKEVEPYPVSTRDITDSDYRFTFTIEPHNPGGVTPVATGKCYVGGCSAQICSDEPDVASSCEYKAEYACYQTATCERQATGKCGWTQTAFLSACLLNA